ncbi:hypothetical protein [Streptomyces lateritius]|uniref:hypothetical protein n=1 Tax=Streptomyces lateritius TaxID=67313 RepID=UPI001C8B2980|nr:hypothetical protein [Streptomyces lateritius]MBX9420981.1 hypothetical protein [Streptomyces lateritius]
MERFWDVMAAAEERYAPVRAEIRRRLALAKEEARREREELERRWAAREAQRRERERVCLARSGRCHALARELEELGQGEGLVSVRWETAARERVVSECSTPADPVRFGQWWTEVAGGRWRSPGEVPPPSSSSPGPADGRGHSGSDYGGAGGDFGGGHSGGGFSGGFGGGF